MIRIINYIKKTSNSQKITMILVLLSFILLLSIGLPSLARFINRGSLVTTAVWDGSVSTSFKSGNGTENDPYIISNGSELAFLYTELLNSNYENSYFELSNDIVLNKGVFNYNNGNIEYIIDNDVYYVDEYTNKYYDNVEKEGTEIGTVNIFQPLDSFNGIFNGKSYRIYGLYLTSDSADNLGLFTNFYGTVNNLYVENSIIYGGIISGGISSNSESAELNNVLFNGFVVGKTDLLPKSVDIPITTSNIDVELTETTENISLINSVPFIGSEIVLTTVTGNYVINGGTDSNTTIKINGTTVTAGVFEVSLGTNILDSVSVSTVTSSLEDVTLSITNMKYNVTYKSGVSGGIIGYSNGTILKNSVNKSKVFGYSISGGLIGFSESSLYITNAYNTGSINSGNVSGGLIGAIEKNTENTGISRAYNSGNIISTNKGGLIGIIKNNTGSVTLLDSFDASVVDYSIDKISSSTVNVANVYYVSGVGPVNEGTINGAFLTTTLTNLKTKSFIISDVLYSEFVDMSDLLVNTNNVWLFEEDSLPILYIDDYTNSIASINYSVYSWDNLSFDLSTIKINSSISFSIEELDELRPLKEIYYYLSTSSTPLTQTEISLISLWTEYTSVVQIPEEGSYVIYAKVVDFDDNVTYLNSDLLDYNVSGPLIKLNDSEWTNFKTNLDYEYIDRDSDFNVDIESAMPQIHDIKYYISSSILDFKSIEKLSLSSWINYDTSIPIHELGTYIIYVRLVDAENDVSYLNTDYIVYDGYNQESFIIGRNANSYTYENLYITSKSTITINMKYNKEMDDYSGATHNIMTSILLPINTTISLLDNITNKVYQYTITSGDDIYGYEDSCSLEELNCVKKAKYSLTMFKEVGAINKNYVESSYFDSGEVNEDFSIILDFSKTNTADNIENVKVFMELFDSNMDSVRPTLFESIKSFNIYKDNAIGSSNATLKLSTNYSLDPLYFNSNSNIDISITSGLDYKKIEGLTIIDTLYENKKIGIELKLEDSEGNVIGKEHLKNIKFIVDETLYSPKEDNIVRININNGINDVTKVLSIVTYENNDSLEEGTYYLKINNYVSNDGYYYDVLSDEEISVPIIVSNVRPNSEYSFNVFVDEEDRIISKENEEHIMDFDILQNGELDNPNIRVSLYKKDQLTAFNQDYTLVNLQDYVSNTLSLSKVNEYYALNDPLQYNGEDTSINSYVLNLITANFDNTGYKFVFYLYDDSTLIGSIEKHFIVK